MVKNCKIFITLIIFSLAAIGLSLSAGHAGGETSAGCEVGCVLTECTGSAYASCEPASSIVSTGSNGLSYTFPIKDFHKFFYYPHGNNSHLERESHDYIFFTETFPATEGFTMLRRLNI